MLPANHLLRRAKWIWPVRAPVFNQYANFRKDFTLLGVPKHAPFFISADQSYKLWVNGRYAGRGPARGFQVSWPFDEYDIASYLRVGHNWIAVEAYNPGVSNFQYIHQGYAGFICAARWGSFELISKEDWLGRVDPSRNTRTARLSIQLAFQEHVDARLTTRDWIHRASPPEDWERAIPASRGVFGTPPWHDMEPRNAAMLQCKIRRFRKVVGSASGKCGKGYAGWVDPFAGFHGELKKLKWGPCAAQEPITIPPSGRDRLRAVVLDMGELTVANLVVEVARGRGGEIIDFLFTEVLIGAAPAVILHPTSRVAMLNRLRLRRGTTRHEFFHLIGFRYLTLIVRNSTTRLRFRLRARESLYDLDIKGSFRSSDPTVNAIWKVCRRTQQVCCLDAYVDTPWREQAQWWGDARVQAANTFHLSADSRLLLRGIRQIGFQETPKGLTYGHAPTTAHHCVLPDFSLTWLLTLYDYYWQTGDPSLAVELWPRIERLLAYFDNEATGHDGLLRHDPRYWLFLDWARLHRAGTPALLSMWYLLALQKLAEVLAAANSPQAMKQVERRCRRLKRAILRNFWDERTERFIDGLDEGGRKVRTSAIHTQVLAILCDLKPRAHRRIAESLLLPHLMGKPAPGPVPSSYWIHYEFLAMRELGFGQAVIEFIRREWAKMVPYGGTFECFNLEFGRGSVSHAWAAHPLVHLTAILGGVVQTAPAWREIRFRPLLNVNLRSAKVTVPCPSGLISAAWHKSKDGTNVQIHLPPGVSAQVELPSISEKAAGKSKWFIPLERPL